MLSQYLNSTLNCDLNPVGMVSQPTVTLTTVTYNEATAVMLCLLICYFVSDNCPYFIVQNG